MLHSEDLIALVQVNPEIWDQGHANYSNKIKKFKCWTAIAEKLNCRVEEAKSRWTNLRDLFRRELKKSIRIAKETGDSVHEPRWRHFKAMLYLKDHVVRDEFVNSVQFDEFYSVYPQTILEDESGDKNDDDNLNEEESNSTPSYEEREMMPSSSKKRHRDHSEDRHQSFNKRHHHGDEKPNGVVDYGEYVSRPLTEIDEDYHFLMSILPSIRRVKQERKTSFKMKVLQLIVDEEKAESEFL